MVLDAQYLAASDIQGLIVNVLVLLVLPVRRVVAIVVQRNVWHVAKFVFASAVWGRHVLGPTLSNVDLVGPLIPSIGIRSNLFLAEYAASVHLVLILPALVVVLRAQPLLVLALPDSALRQVSPLLAGRVDPNVGVVDRLVDRVALLLVPNERPIALGRAVVVEQGLALGLHLVVLGRDGFGLLAARGLGVLQVDVGLAQLVRTGLRVLAVDQGQVDLVL